ncbi:Dynamin central region-domain-containing protein [Mycena haematopus]|nr:Dynamin central region-domain-containing protein [Mycena haematopus]
MAGSNGLGVELVSIMNKLQGVFANLGSNAAQIDLPQICVLGSQSSGKSSVLENIVGRDFLPRGSGIVTRRPLVLQLINSASSGSSTSGASNVTNKSLDQDEWVFNFHEIRNEIVRDTEAKTGRNAGISPFPINLRIYSPNVLTLTLVDLPGLAKVPVGDPRDLEKQIRDMLMTYISRPTCIILAVTPANQDLANSEGLKIARDVDPEGDTGTNVIDVLAGRVIPLRLGYVPVVNRGQRDIDSNRPISSALQKEHEFFENHPAYKANIKFCGTPFLAQKLNNILKAQIRSTLPTIKASINERHQRLWMELQTLGGPVAAGNSANVLSTVITDFATEFGTAIDGTNAGALSLNELSGGARIAFVFHQLFSTAIKNINPLDQITDADIRSILYCTAGTSPALFIGTAGFEVLVKTQVKRLEEPSLKCCQLVYDELLRILSVVLGKMPALRQYPALRERLHSVVLGFFKKSMEPTRKLVSDMVAMQACYINTTHPDFIGGHQATAIVNDRINAARPATSPDLRSAKGPPGQVNNGRDLDAPPPSSQAPLNARDTMETQVIRLLITSYFNIVKREMIDTVPKAISLTLITHATKNIQQELLQELYKPEGITELLKESEAVVTRRRDLTAMVDALSKAEE